MGQAVCGGHAACSGRRSTAAVLLFVLLLITGCTSEGTSGQALTLGLSYDGFFSVATAPVKTGVRVEKGERILILGLHEVNFGGGVLGIGAPVFGADGDQSLDATFPMPHLRKYSLGYRIGDGPWLQGAVSTAPGLVADRAGEVELAPNDTLLEDNTGAWTVKIYTWRWVLTGYADADDDRLRDDTERSIGTRTDRRDTDGDGLHDGAETLAYDTDPLNERTGNNPLLDWGTVSVEMNDGDANPDPNRYPDCWGCPVPRERSDDTTDTDGDGIWDAVERMDGSDPLRSNSDKDGLSDWDERRWVGSDPVDADTDDDGLSDGEEIRRFGSSPFAWDTDKDKVIDIDEVVARTSPRKWDSDGDGQSDWNEINLTKTDPTVPDPS